MRRYAAGFLLLVVLSGCTRTGADQSGETVVKFTVDGQATGEQLDATVKLLDQRAQQLGWGRPTVTKIDGGTIELRVPGHHGGTQIAGLVQPGRLTMRKVLDVVPAKPGGAAEPGGRTTADTVREKLAGAMAAAAALSPDTAGNPANDLPPFATLTGAEVATLPPRVQFVVNDVTCAQLGVRPQATDPAAPAVACGDLEKYSLSAAAVTSADVAKAEARQDNGVWGVLLSFTPESQSRWTELTRQAFGNTGDQPCTERAAAVGGGNCAVAILVDDDVISAPTVQGVITGPAQIVGGYDEAGARVLAAELSTAALPVRLLPGPAEER
ncbi:SecDF P1 head subdomain-containing protein [Hamadaea tsunoensis]|uniref:SecDF P1 head subdomain-containing protein n=1 Tax=Hamadaea tsunoensis TaxID=53368 RepID=UPI00040784E7|nr:hypothetical protein [Hamadaea tsunoensis]